VKRLVLLLAILESRSPFSESIDRPLGGSALAAIARLGLRSMAALLGLRDTALACEELVLRARADSDAGRGREAALQLRVGLEALLAERKRLTGHGQEPDLDELAGRRGITGEAANEALQGRLSAEREREVEETLAICERVLRRRAAHGWETGG